jgi:type IV pilus assembly protein PilA
VNTITTNANGLITVQIATGIKSDVDNQLVTLAPMVSGAVANAALPPTGNMGTGPNAWRCGSTTDGTNLNQKYLPGSCRGN